jgi:2-polyprenyl-3-methyl-5-hydroxy-6-metoxy-1,4-benzoquinol methylase
MDESDRERWNRKHAQGRGGAAPSPRFVEALEQAPPGRALDVACGSGRHALPLARAGFDVLAVDVSDVALERLAAQAAARGLAVRTERRDVSAEGLPEGDFDLVVVIGFLDRTLFPALREKVRPGGLLFFETFTRAHSEATGFPRAYCLEPGELLAAFEGWETLRHVEERARESLLARRPARLTRRAAASSGRGGTRPRGPGPWRSCSG